MLFLSAIVVVAGAAAGYAVVKGRRSSAAIATPERVSMAAVVRASRRDLTKTVTLDAELRPWVVSDVYAKIPGYLSQIFVDYGSKVSAGQTIATLEVPEQQADLQQTQAAYSLAKVDYDRILSVVHQTPGLLSQEDVDKAKAAYEEAKDARDRAQVMIDYSVITAPFSGVVTKRYVDPGALIQQGTASSTQARPIVEVADTYNLRLVLETPESIVQDIHVGTPVDVKIDSTGQTLRRQVDRFSYDVHADTRTMHTEVDVPNPDMRLKPGMYATATIDLATHRNVIALPVQAVATDPSPNVWVVDANGSIAERPVSIGLQTANWIEVSHGIRDGDLVIFGNRAALSTGMKVEPKIQNVTASSN